MNIFNEAIQALKFVNKVFRIVDIRELPVSLNSIEFTIQFIGKHSKNINRAIVLFVKISQRIRICQKFNQIA